MLTTSTILPVSFHQLRLISRPGRTDDDPGNVVFHWRGRGQIDPEQIKVAVYRLIERHGALRTTFGMTEAGDYMQVIASSARDEQFTLIEADDNRHAGDVVAAKMSRACPSFSDGPLFYFFLITGTADEFDIVVAIEHVVVDEGSTKVLRRDFLTLMTDPEKLSDEAPLNRQGLAGESPADSEFWRLKLAQLPPRVFAERHDRSLAGQPHIVSSIELTIEEAARVCGHARDARVSLVAYFLSAVVLGVRAMSGASDLAIGTPADTRDNEDELETVGYFQNLLPIVVRSRPDESVQAVRRNVAEALMEMLEHRRFPLLRLIDMVDRTDHENVHPLHEIIFSYCMPGCDIWEIPGAELHPVIEDGPSQLVEMNVSVNWREDGRCSMGVTIDPSLVSPEELNLGLVVMRAALLMPRDRAEGTRTKDFLERPTVS